MIELGTQVSGLTLSSLNVGYVSTYPPRACGIATFTRDLATALIVRHHVGQTVVLPIKNDLTQTTTDSFIDQYERRSYVDGAGFLNGSNLDVVSLQHEFGIFGGEWGEYVLDLCRNLELPLVTTFHTVIPKPDEKPLGIVREICRLSAKVVVTLESAKNLLEAHYGIPAQKVDVIRHGGAVPDQRRRSYARDALHLRNRTVLSTTGLINAGKGIEFAIKSLPYLTKQWPNILYLVIGETHPEVRKREGETYRSNLIELTKQLKVQRNVKFIDRFLPETELSMYMQATDVYVAPYVGRDQVSSGTITFALTHGRAIVSTPTIFAEEALSNGRGLLCDFKDEYTIARLVRRILDDSKLRRSLEVNAFKYGRELGWAKVADEYANVLRSAKQLEGIVAEASELSQV